MLNYIVITHFILLCICIFLCASTCVIYIYIYIYVLQVIYNIYVKYRQSRLLFFLDLAFCYFSDTIHFLWYVHDSIIVLFSKINSSFILILIIKNLFIYFLWCSVLMCSVSLHIIICILYLLYLLIYKYDSQLLIWELVKKIVVLLLFLYCLPIVLQVTLINLVLIPTIRLYSLEHKLPVIESLFCFLKLQSKETYTGSSLKYINDYKKDRKLTTKKKERVISLLLLILYLLFFILSILCYIMIFTVLYSLIYTYLPTLWICKFILYFFFIIYAFMW